MKLITSIIIVLLFPLLLLSQDVVLTNKVNWEENLSFKEVLERARKENKTVFLDVYATWCGPCKEMDKSVYTNDTIANLLNERVISVKVQIDKSKKDNKRVQEWYADADTIAKTYRIQAFPTMLFLNPDGSIRSKVLGFHSVKKLSDAVEDALKPGKVYKDPDERYFQLRVAYMEGRKSYDSMPYMYDVATRLEDKEIKRSVLKDYNNFLTKQWAINKHILFDSATLKFMEQTTISTASTWYGWLQKNRLQVNKTMKDKYFVERMIDKIFQIRVVDSFLHITRTMPMMGGETDLAEADWEGLEKELKKKGAGNHTARILLESKFMWYDTHFNFEKFAVHYARYINRYGFDANERTSITWVNFYCYAVFFKKIQDLESVKYAAGWMEVITNKYPSSAMLLDTYACLLYKSGKKEEAIEVEQKALAIVINRGSSKRTVDSYQEVLNRMKNGSL